MSKEKVTGEVKQNKSTLTNEIKKLKFMGQSLVENKDFDNLINDLEYSAKKVGEEKIIAFIKQCVRISTSWPQLIQKLTFSNPSLDEFQSQIRLKELTNNYTYEEGDLLKCKRCGNKSVTVTNIQARSLDEGQSAFYVCKVCGLKTRQG